MARIGTRMTNHSEPPVAAAAILLALSNFLPSVRPGFKRIGRTAETLLGRTKSLVGPASRRPSASAREDGRLESTTLDYIKFHGRACHAKVRDREREVMHQLHMKRTWN